MRGSLLRCTFCGKSQNEVAKLIAGPQVWICDGCVRECVRVLLDEGVLPDPETARAEHNAHREALGQPTEEAP